MSKEKLTNQLKKAYKKLEEEFNNKGRPNTIEDNNVDYDNCNIYAMRQKIKDLEAKLAEKENRIEQLENGIRKIEDNKNKEVQQIREFWKERYKKLDNEYNQDKISFAVEKLEKVKEWLWDSINDETPCGDVIGVREAIDKLIKELKEGK